MKLFNENEPLWVSHVYSPYKVVKALKIILTFKLFNGKDEAKLICMFKMSLETETTGDPVFCTVVIW